MKLFIVSRTFVLLRDFVIRLQVKLLFTDSAARDANLLGVLVRVG